MAGSFNKVLLMGNLTRDPELKSTPSNTSVANIGLAVNERWKNKQTDQWEERVNFIDCEAWGRTAEIMNQYLQKGRPVFIEGRLKFDQWKDQEGNNRSKLKVVIENFQFVDSKGDGGGGSGGGSGNPGSVRTESYQTPAPAAAAVDRQPVNEEDIPF